MEQQQHNADGKAKAGLKPRPRPCHVGFKTGEAAENRSRNSIGPTATEMPSEATDFHTTAREKDLQKLRDGSDDTWLGDVDCAEHILPMPAAESLTALTSTRLQLMQEVDEQLQATPTPKEFAPFRADENQDVDNVVHEVDP